MYVVHVVRQFYPGVGGLENHVLDLARAQVAAGDRIRVVTLDRLFKDETQERLAATEMLDGIEIVRIPFSGSQRYPLALSVLRHLDGADIVHVHAIDFFFDFLGWTRPLHRHKLVATTHGGFFHTNYAARLKRVWFSTITRLSSMFYDAIVACSTSDYERFRTVCPGRVRLIEDGVNTSKFHDAAAKQFQKSLIAIGRFSQNKRVDLLLRFAEALAAKDPDWRLTIAGRPDDLRIADIDALIRSAGLESSVRVVDSPSDAELKQLMADSSFLASASDYEGFGMTSIEGMSAGLFPVLSDIPPFRSLVARTGLGLILDFNDSEAAANTLLQRAADMASYYGEQRRACMTAAEAYDWAHISAEIGALYETILGIGMASSDEAAPTQPFDEASGSRQASLGKH